MIMAELRLRVPEWESGPYQVKRTAVRDACRAMSNVKAFNRQLAADRARGERLEIWPETPILPKALASITDVAHTLSRRIRLRLA